MDFFSVIPSGIPCVVSPKVISVIHPEALLGIPPGTPLGFLPEIPQKYFFGDYYVIKNRQNRLNIVNR